MSTLSQQHRDKEIDYAHGYGRNPIPARPDFAWAPYGELQESKLSGGGPTHVYISACSLIEYIGVEWCTRIPDEEKIAYMRGIFNTLAEAGNDDASLSAFVVLRDIHESTELHRRCKDLYVAKTQSPQDEFRFSWCEGMEHPYFPKQKLVDVVRQELRHELLLFIREQLHEILFSYVRSGIRHTTHIETRKKMIATCGEGWDAIPHNKNDELAFAIFCDTAVCDLNHRPSAKELHDTLHQVLRDALNRIHLEGKTAINWKHWLTRPEHPTRVEPLLNVLSKTRTAVLGYHSTLLDIEARERSATSKK